MRLRRFNEYQLPRTMQAAKKRLVFVINHAAFFVSHRLPIALAALDRGWEVTLITGQAGSPSMEKLAEKEIVHHRLRHKRAFFRTVGLDPFSELAGLVQLVLWLWKLKPTIVHTASPKASLYGGIASRLVGVSSLVVAISGMGYLFTGHARGAKAVLRSVYGWLLKFVFRHPNKTVIVQNREDEASLLASGLLTPDEISLIPGSGVDLRKYLQIRENTASSMVVVPARILRDKGIEEFVNAARILKQRGITWRFVLVGAADYANPSAIPIASIKAWTSEGVVEWWGHRENMIEVYEMAGIVCLPSYREGMPKCLLEAAAAGRPVVTTDVTGCREAILSGITGEMVPVRDANALADALGVLINDPARRARYGSAGRHLAIQRYGIESVIDQTLKIYCRLSDNAER